VMGERVGVVDKGKLLTLLMGRIPSKKIDHSNGHARRYSPAGGFHGSTTNLFVSSAKGLSHPQLVAKLLAAAREEGLPFAMIVRQLDDAAITAEPEQNLREMRALINQTDVAAPPPAVLAYKVYPNGKEELVRGVELGPVDLRVWKDVLATGTTRTVHNFLASQNNNLLFKVRGVGAGFVPSSGVESAIVTPDLLMREIELSSSDAGRYLPPAVPRPTPPK
jgi:TldD protein